MALAGGRADRVPIVPIYDRGYILGLMGRDQRDNLVCSPEQWAELQEQVLLRHPTDGVFVHTSPDREWLELQQVERLEDHWRVTDAKTGVRYKAMPDGAVKA